MATLNHRLAMQSVLIRLLARQCRQSVQVDQGNKQMSEIDLREFGKLEAQVETLQSEVYALRNDVKTLLEMANKSKGGLWAGMAIVSVLSSVAAFILDRTVFR
jgi:cell division protein FtsB